MAERVKQHYVPQFYFRNFADSGRLCCYNLNNEAGYQPTPISNICYENHFYGEDDEQEAALSRLESELASTIHTIVDQQSLDSIESDPRAKFFLDLFLSHTHSRTKAAREEADELTQSLFETISEVGVEAEELGEEVLQKIRDGEIRLEGPDHAQRQLISFYGPLYLYDLDRALIRNNTDINFITSDHPVVFDNRRFKDEIDVGTTGLSSAGLQIFCPLANDLLILLYDSDAYEVESDEEDIIDTDSERMVVGLNKLQLVHCLENCYYRDEGDGNRIDEWYQDVKECRSGKSVESRKFSFYDPNQGRERTFVTTRGTPIEYSPWLPPVKQWVSAEYRPIRNPRGYQIAQNLYDEAIAEAEARLESEYEGE